MSDPKLEPKIDENANIYRVGEKLTVFICLYTTLISTETLSRDACAKVRAIVAGGEKTAPRKMEQVLARMPLQGLVGLVCTNVSGPFPALLQRALRDMRGEVRNVAGFSCD